MRDDTKELTSQITVTLNTVGEVIIVLMALDSFAFVVQENGKMTVADATRGLINQILNQVPVDWNCGDPECQSCNAVMSTVGTIIDGQLGKPGQA